MHFRCIYLKTNLLCFFLLLLQCDKKEGGWDYKDDEDKYKFKDDYDFKNDYDDDKCTADDLEECCSANEKIQWQICKTLGCNIRKVS